MRLMLLLSRAADDRAAAAAAAVGGPTGDEPVNPLVSDMLQMNRDTDHDEGLLFQLLYRHRDDQQKEGGATSLPPPLVLFLLQRFLFKTFVHLCSRI